MPDDAPHLLSPRGFRAAGVAANIKQSGKPDVALLVADAPASAAAIFTQNKVVSPAVTVGFDHVRRGAIRAVAVNSGNANACTGEQGMADARRTCDLVGELIGCDPRLVLPGSTGIIGHPLPMPKLEAGLRHAAIQLGDSPDHAVAFADAILTTDLVRKTAATTVTLSGATITVAGVTKGSGMIGPSLAPTPGGPGAINVTPPHATMLAYLTTDVAAPPAMLRRALVLAAERSFNALTVDGHSSTNDTLALLASGAGGADLAGSPTNQRAFLDAVTEVCRSLAYQIAADGEGATKVVVVRVAGARTDADARAMARAVADSPLVKCAMHGNDPNWGRIVSAAGLAGVPFDADRCELTLQGTPVFRRGVPLAFDAAAVSRALDAKEVTADLSCGLGGGAATVYTCDLSREYVTINADYHT